MCPAAARVNGARAVTRLSSGAPGRVGGGVTFEEFARASLPALLRFSTVLANDRALGEDLVQDVMLRAHERWAHISRVDDPASYVRRMIVNEFISWRRKWSRIVPRSDIAQLADWPDSSDYAVAHAERVALARDIGRLPRKQRAVIVLRYYEDLADDEIARILGCSPNTVRVHGMRGLRALRVRLTTDDTTAARTTQ
jgi:RNA polymerase sigma-70 factor (sigma-E family)